MRPVLTKEGKRDVGRLEIDRRLSYNQSSISNLQIKLFFPLPFLLLAHIRKYSIMIVPAYVQCTNYAHPPFPFILASCFHPAFPPMRAYLFPILERGWSSSMSRLQSLPTVVLDFSPKQRAWLTLPPGSSKQTLCYFFRLWVSVGIWWYKQLLSYCNFLFLSFRLFSKLTVSRSAFPCADMVLTEKFYVT